MGKTTGFLEFSRELPEKRLPQDVLTLSEVERLHALPDVCDPFGVRDCAMLELFYSTGNPAHRALPRVGHPT